MPGLGELLILGVVIVLAAGGGGAIFVRLRDQLGERTARKVEAAVKARVPAPLRPLADEVARSVRSGESSPDAPADASDDEGAA